MAPHFTRVVLQCGAVECIQIAPGFSLYQDVATANVINEFSLKANVSLVYMVLRWHCALEDILLMSLEWCMN